MAFDGSSTTVKVRDWYWRFSGRKSERLFGRALPTDLNGSEELLRVLQENWSPAMTCLRTTANASSSSVIAEFEVPAERRTYTHTYELDPARNWVITGVSRYGDGRLLSHVSNLEYQQLNSGMWYPVKGRSEEFGRGGELIQRVDFEVDLKNCKFAPNSGLALTRLNRGSSGSKHSTR